MNIGEAADKSGLPPKTIRYYEDIALVVPARQENGYRHYTDSDVDQLAFLHHARDLGFEIDVCRKLLELYRNPSRRSANVKKIALQHLDTIENKMKALRKMSKTLKQLINECEGDASPKCAILDGLSSKTNSRR